MRRQAMITAVVVAMVAIAGCGGSVSPGGGDAGEGTVNMYISDQPSAIDDFEHLNVTVTSIAAHRVDEGATEGNESGWVEQEIDNVTVDLTELRGANASELGSIPAPNGSYDKTFIHVSEVDGTLTNGESTDVKLPSSKLHINENFTVGNGEEIDFVFDITVVTRGNSGSYNIQPVVGESGTDQEIEQRPEAEVEGGDEESAEDETATEAPTTDSENASSVEGAGSLEFYVSDQQNAIGDFAHLNVTIEKVGVHRANTGDNESAWVERSVNNTTVDLTELQGANATSLGTMAVPNGSYDKTFVHVSEVNGTLTSGETTDVKLPSSKLRLNAAFTVGNGEALDYVFDITVVKRGNSGSYNIQPVAGESGTGDQVEIENNDGESEGNETETESEAETETETETADNESAAALTLSLDGNATAGENVTVSVSRNGSAVAGAAVSVDGEAVGETGPDGTLVVRVPADAEEIEIGAQRGDAEAESTFPVERNTSTEAPALVGPTAALA